MTAIEECSISRDELKSCLSATNFINRMTGSCDALKKQYEACMGSEFAAMRQRNLVKGRLVESKWKEARREIGLE